MSSSSSSSLGVSSSSSSSSSYSSEGFADTLCVTGGDVFTSGNYVKAGTYNGWPYYSHYVDTYGWYYIFASLEDPYSWYWNFGPSLGSASIGPTGHGVRYPWDVDWSDPYGIDVHEGACSSSSSMGVTSSSSSSLGISSSSSSSPNIP